MAFDPERFKVLSKAMAYLMGAREARSEAKLLFESATGQQAGPQWETELLAAFDDEVAESLRAVTRG